MTETEALAALAALCDGAGYDTITVYSVRAILAEVQPAPAQERLAEVRASLGRILSGLRQGDDAMSVASKVLAVIIKIDEATS